MKNNSLSIVALLQILIFCLPILGQAFECQTGSSKYLVNRLCEGGLRYSSSLLVLKLLELNKAKILVETGTARNGDTNFHGDGGSTIIYGDWAKQNNAFLWTVDISPTAIANAKAATQEFKDNIHFVCGDSIQFLNNFDHSIDFLYLDSFDFESENPKPSQEHHLKEIIAAYPKLHAHSIVMIDDCDLPHGGKGKLVIEFLLEKGWMPIYKGYQTILMKN